MVVDLRLIDFDLVSSINLPILTNFLLPKQNGAGSEMPYVHFNPTPCARPSASPCRWNKDFTALSSAENSSFLNPNKNGDAPV